jgi:Na+/melibiose symporter-like transporter
MHTIILQTRVLDFIPEAEKNTYLNILISTGLVLAMVVQPIVGAISDRSGFRWGRRRPFILVGVMALLLLLLGIGLAGSYVVLFTIYCLMQVSSNIAQGPHQGFIPDLVPEGKRGLASGVKGFLEVLGGVALLYFISAFMDKYADGLGSGWLWLSLLLPGILLLGLMATTLIMVKEQPGTGGLRLPAVTFNLNIRIYRSFLPSMTSRLAVFVKTHRSFLWFLASRLLFFLAMSIIQRFALY